MDETLRKIFAETFAYGPNGFSDALSPNDIAAWDSLGHLRLVTAIQEKYGIELDVDEIMRMENVGKIKEILRHRGLET